MEIQNSPPIPRYTLYKIQKYYGEEIDTENTNTMGRKYTKYTKCKGEEIQTENKMVRKYKLKIQW